MKTAYVVLGMHRSGTSSVAGALTLLGAAAPRTLMQAAADNPTGFWESEKITEFNDEVLHAAGSSWLDWGALDPAVFSGEHAEHFHSASRWLIRRNFVGPRRSCSRIPEFAAPILSGARRCSTVAMRQWSFPRFAPPLKSPNPCLPATERPDRSGCGCG